MQKKTFGEQYKMSILLLGSIAIGALLGTIAPGFGTKLKPLGDIFLNLMFTIVVHLVFASITSAAGTMVNMTSKLARSCVAVKDLPKGVSCEIEAIAVK